MTNADETNIGKMRIEKAPGNDRGGNKLCRQSDFQN